MRCVIFSTALDLGPCDGWSPEASSEWRRQVMTDKVAEARYSVSDVVAVAIYSVLVLVLMLAWAYVPA